jgi:hypothetical protein
MVAVIFMGMPSTPAPARLHRVADCQLFIFTIAMFLESFEPKGSYKNPNRS